MKITDHLIEQGDEEMNTLFVELTWWQIAIVLIYTLYTLIRAYFIYAEGFLSATLAYGDTLKLYHILWAVIDIPAIIIGMFYPVLKYLFSVPIFDWKKKQS